MVFSSLLFIFQFMPLFFLLYYIIPERFRNIFLLCSSLFFYGWGEPRFILLIVCSILINYAIGRGMECYNHREKIRVGLLIVAIFYNFGMLVFFKYTNFILENVNRMTGDTIHFFDITLPLGISFYTFQIMSYTVDVYWRKTKAEKSIVNLGAYLCMFPQLIAGPIVVYSQVSNELKKRVCTLEKCEDGLKTFVLGLGSKVLIANNIGALWNDMEVIGFSNLSMPLAWLGIIAYTLQIYFDFNGYSLMAIGLGKMMGFQFPKNFNHPYIARSITDFWRRWHITLSSWFREYLYIPLGGNRKGRIRMYVNLFVVWSITGLWHGAGWNFILWGIYFFVFLAIEKCFLLQWLNKSKVISRVYTLIVIAISWLIFAVTNVKDIMTYLQKMFSFDFSSNQWIYYLKSYGVIIVIGILLSTPLLEKWYQKRKDSVLSILLLMGIFLLSIAYLVDAAYNPFLYFRF